MFIDPINKIVSAQDSINYPPTLPNENKSHVSAKIQRKIPLIFQAMNHGIWQIAVYASQFVACQCISKIAYRKQGRPQLGRPCSPFANCNPAFSIARLSMLNSVIYEKLPNTI